MCLWSKERSPGWIRDSLVGSETPGWIRDPLVRLNTPWLEQTHMVIPDTACDPGRTRDTLV